MSPNKAIEKYLDTLHYELSSMSISEKAEIITEIKSHINDRLEFGDNIDDILNALGSPSIVARKYLKEKGIPEAKQSPGCISFFLKWFCILVLSLFLLVVLGIGGLFWFITKKDNVSSILPAANNIFSATTTDHKVHIDENSIQISVNDNFDPTNPNTSSTIIIDDNGISVKNNNSNSVENKKNVQMGRQKIENESLTSFDSYGDLNISSSSIKGDLKVFGALDAVSFTVDNLSVFGEASLENSTVNEDANINGRIVLKSSNIKGNMQVFGDITARASNIGSEITISGKKAKFVASKTKDIVMRANKVEPEQILILKKNTIVQGNIIFESGQGTIEKDDTVRIDGEIIGAIIK